MDSLYIVIPAYNEESNIAQVVADWYPIVEAYHGNGESRLVILDDGSKDNTYAILQKLAADRPMLTPLTKPNSGHGGTVLTGYHYALNNGADFVFQTDSDGQTLSSEFHEFWDMRNDYDMVIGHRSSRGDGQARVFVTKVLKLVVRICFGVTIPDANTPFRLMNAETLKQNISYIPDNFNLSNVLLSVIYAKAGKKVRFIPITFRPRQGGVNSINMKSIYRIGKKAVKDFTVLNKQLAAVDWDYQRVHKNDEVKSK